MKKKDEALILQCLKVEEAKDKAARLARFSASDWETILTQAWKQGLGPMIAWQINALSPDEFPPDEIRRRLRQSLLIGTGNNLKLLNELGKVLRQLKQADIPVIVLKGAHLAAVVYEHIGLRLMCDIDLLVNMKDIKNSSEVLKAMGYMSEAVFTESKDTHFEKHHLPDFCKPNARPIEVHWTIVNDMSPFRVAPEEVWKEAQETTIDGYPALALSPCDQIIYLCMHAYAHKFDMGLRPFVDLVQVMRYYQGSIHWEQVKQRAQDWKASRCVFLMLYTANRLFGSPSQTLLEALKPAEYDPQLVEALLNKTINMQPTDAEMKNDLGNDEPSLYFIKLTGNLNLAEKAALVWKRIFLPPKEIAQDYEISADSPKVYFYYLLRIWDLISRYGRLGSQKAIRSKSGDGLASPETMLAKWIASE